MGVNVAALDYEKQGIPIGDQPLAVSVERLR